MTQLRIFNQGANWRQRVTAFMITNESPSKMALVTPISEAKANALAAASLNFVAAITMLQQLRTRGNNKTIFVSNYDPKT